MNVQKSLRTQQIENMLFTGKNLSIRTSILPRVSLESPSHVAYTLAPTFSLFRMIPKALKN